MAMEFFDAMDWTTSTTIAQRKWGSAIGALAITAGSGRFGGNRIQGRWITPVLSNAATRFASMSLFLNAAFANTPFIAFRDTGTQHIEIRTTTSGFVTITRNGTLLATSTRQLSLSTWYHVEVKVFVSDTVGTVDVWIDGESTATVSFSGDTRNGVNAYSNEVDFGQNGSNIQFCFPMTWDTTGSVNNDRLGDRRIQTKFPTGAGDLTQWTPLAGANWQNVDESAVDDDTTYNSSATVGQKDLYGVGGFTVPSINAVQVCAQMRKDDATLRETRIISKSGATTTNDTTRTLSTSYQHFRHVQETNPNTGAAWTLSGLNALQPGVEVVT